MPSLALAFDILARDKGAADTLRDVGDAADDTGGKLANLGGAGTLAVGGLAAIGGLAAAALFKGFDEALDRETANDKLAAQLGLNPEQQAAFGRAAGDIYADAYGESIGQVNEALGAVQSTFQDSLDGADDALETTTIKALDLATAFDVDVSEAVDRAGILVRTGLAKDVDEAFDLVVASMQRMNPALRDELGDATTEYSKFFADLGISGSEMLGLFAQADDIFELDKTGDAIKEFTIRATDMSTLTRTTFESMGMDAERMAARLLEGGETARDAFEEIITGLYEIEDPVARANAAIALFGTPLEDLGVNEIPAFLVKLGEMETGLGDVAGKADALGTTLNDNAATKIETFKRQAMQGLVDFLGSTVIPEIEDVADAWGEDGFSGALDLIVDEKLPEWMDAFGDWVTEEGVPAMLDAGKELGGAIARGYIEGIKELTIGGGIWAELGASLGVTPFAGEAEVNPLDPTGEQRARDEALLREIMDITDWVSGRDVFKAKGLAGGTDYWQGGWSWVGEDGPELLNIPRGAAVVPHGESMAMAGAMGGSSFDAVGEDQLLELRQLRGLIREQNELLRGLGNPSVAQTRAAAVML